MKALKLSLLMLILIICFLPTSVYADNVTISAPPGVVTIFTFDDSTGDPLNERLLVFTAQTINITFNFFTDAPSFTTSMPGGLPDSLRVTANTDFDGDGINDEVSFVDNSSGIFLDFFGEFGPHLSGFVVDNIGTSDPYTAAAQFTITGLSSTSPTVLTFALMNDDQRFSTRVAVKAEPQIPEPATLVLLGSGLAGLNWLRRRRAKLHNIKAQCTSDHGNAKILND